MTRPRFRSLALLLLLALSVTAGFISRAGWAAPRIPRTVETSGLEFVTPQVQKNINRGLAYLAARQNDDGSFGTSHVYRQNVAIASLAGMAFLSAGNTPGRGQYGEAVEKTVRFVMTAAERNQASGFINIPEGSLHGPMYGHGFATLFLAEVYGMTARDDVHDTLERAVKLIVSTQNTEGGWRYQPVRGEADLSVTVCQIMALRAARNCGIYVPKETVDRCIKYVNDAQNADGGFKYQLLRGSQSMFPRSAAGVVALYSAGVYEGKAIERGIRYLENFVPQGDVFRHETHYYYGQYYAVQAMWHTGGPAWERWYPAIREELLRQQMPDGCFPDALCNEYGTAMACIVLQMPNNYLPIFQR